MAYTQKPFEYFCDEPDKLSPDFKEIEEPAEVCLLKELAEFVGEELPDNRKLDSIFWRYKEKIKAGLNFREILIEMKKHQPKDGIEKRSLWLMFKQQIDQISLT